MENLEPISKAEVGARLRLTREALGLSQAQLCRMMGVSQALWNNAETGDHYPSPMNVSRFCQITGATSDWVYRGIRYALPSSLLERITARENPGTDTNNQPKRRPKRRRHA